MVRTAPVSSAFLIAAFVLSLGTSRTVYEVTVENLTYMQPFSPIVLVAHSEDIQIFEKGASATDDLRELAEGGNLTSLLGVPIVPALAGEQSTLNEEVNECCLCGLALGSIVLAPGDAQTLTIEVDGTICTNGPLFSMASMLENTNDAFFGIDSISLDTSNTMVIEAPALDAGTEQNNELCSHIPGPACDATSGDLQTDSGEGFIHIHRGFRGIGDLSADVLDWRNPVAEICIVAV